MPRYQIVAQLKRRGIAQWQIARTLGVTVGYVNHVISRRAGATPLVDRIWAELERVLGDDHQKEAP